MCLTSRYGECVCSLRWSCIASRALYVSKGFQSIGECGGGSLHIQPEAVATVAPAPAERAAGNPFAACSIGALGSDHPWFRILGMLKMPFAPF